ncbi:MAG: hypothetical protein RRC07_11220 [Anaerolineae bacterium]|nr:hypothetical protein [Anaerolineae bacterium]
MRYLWQARPWQAFKSFAIIFSFVVNLILIVVLFLTLPLILPAVDNVAGPIVSGLSDSFDEMGNARIVQTIEIDEQIPIELSIPLAATTSVVLSEPVPLAVPATFNLPGGGGTINGTVSLQLPAGMELPVNLAMTVPVSDTIPVQMHVAVDIPLQETDLGPPFNTLQQLFNPLDTMLERLPANNRELMDRITQREPTGGDLIDASPAGAE